MIVALAGGVGAGKFLRGLAGTIPQEEITVIVNTGDDVVLHGLHVSPDVDSVVYSLAGAADGARGWGLAGETWHCLDAMDRYGMDTWFRLGDRDLATHLFRSRRLAAGAGLARVTAEITAAWGVEADVLPMTEDRVTNRILVERDDGSADDLHFQEYLVARRAQDPVKEVRYEGIEDARPLPAALDALEAADGIIFCPSNPVVSIGPILAFPEIRDAVARRKVKAVGISPIVHGAPVRGPADKLMPAASMKVSCVGVAEAYAGLLDTLIIDAHDARLADDVAAAGMRAEVAQTIMSSVPAATHLARVALELLSA